MREASATGTRARVARVRAEYPSHLDYSGVDVFRNPKLTGALLFAFAHAVRSFPGAQAGRGGARWGGRVRSVSDVSGDSAAGSA